MSRSTCCSSTGTRWLVRSDDGTPRRGLGGRGLPANDGLGCTAAVDRLRRPACRARRHPHTGRSVGRPAAGAWEDAGCPIFRSTCRRITGSAAPTARRAGAAQLLGELWAVVSSVPPLIKVARRFDVVLSFSLSSHLEVALAGRLLVGSPSSRWSTSCGRAWVEGAPAGIESGLGNGRQQRSDSGEPRGRRAPGPRHSPGRRPRTIPSGPVRRNGAGNARRTARAAAGRDRGTSRRWKGRRGAARSDDM